MGYLIRKNWWIISLVLLLVISHYSYHSRKSATKRESLF